MNNKRMIYIIAFIFILLSILMTGEVNAAKVRVTVNVQDEQGNPVTAEVYGSTDKGDFSTEWDFEKVNGTRNFPERSTNDPYFTTTAANDFRLKIKIPSGYYGYNEEFCQFYNLDHTIRNMDKDKVTERLDNEDFSSSQYVKDHTRTSNITCKKDKDKDYYEITITIKLERSTEKREIKVDVSYDDINNDDPSNKNFRYIDITNKYYNDSNNFETWLNNVKNASSKEGSSVTFSNNKASENTFFKKFIFAVAPTADMNKNKGYYVEDGDKFAYFRYDYVDKAVYLVGYGDNVYGETGTKISTNKNNPTYFGDGLYIGKHKVWLEGTQLHIIYAVEKAAVEERKVEIEVKYVEKTETEGTEYRYITGSYNIVEEQRRWTVDSNQEYNISTSIERELINTQENVVYDNKGDKLYKHFLVTLKPEAPNGYVTLIDWPYKIVNLIYDYDSDTFKYHTGGNSLLSFDDYKNEGDPKFEFSYADGKLTVIFYLKREPNSFIIPENYLTELGLNEDSKKFYYKENLYYDGNTICTYDWIYETKKNGLYDEENYLEEISGDFLFMIYNSYDGGTPEEGYVVCKIDDSDYVIKLEKNNDEDFIVKGIYPAKVNDENGSFEITGEDVIEARKKCRE